MKTSYALKDIKIIGNTLEIHCIETLIKDDETTQLIGNWRTSFAKKLDNSSDLAIVSEHCTDDDLIKIQVILDTLEVEEIKEIKERELT